MSATKESSLETRSRGMGFTSGQMVAVMREIGTRANSTALELLLIKAEVDPNLAFGRTESA